jgi:FkbM family methyltransferase
LIAPKRWVAQHNERARAGILNALRHWRIRHGREMKNTIKSLLPKAVWQSLNLTRQRVFNTFAKPSFSQEGEDMILDPFLKHTKTGFYVDVGAHHPFRFSNTYRLYQRGWSGLNIDANPEGIAKFRLARPRDINIQAAVSSKRQNLTYYVFNDPALNTFKKDLALERIDGAYSILREETIETVPLCQLVAQYIPPNTKIDLLTVDVEGLDYEVLQSNDWSRFSPEFILAECLKSTSLEQAASDPVTQLLLSHDYSMVAKTMNTVLFRLTRPDPSESVNDSMGSSTR